MKSLIQNDHANNDLSIVSDPKPHTHLSYKDKINRLYGLQNFGIKLGLSQISELLNELDNPHENLKFIHIAGTNGKGSVCSILAESLKGPGFKVGFYSSPHLVSIRERFRINGKGISTDKLSDLIDKVWPTVDAFYSRGIKLTFFEVTVSMAIIYFSQENCDFVLWETGLGGRLDSTNIVTPIITAITGIGLDHEKLLGNSEEKIAFEKGGIIKTDIPIFVGLMSNSAFNVINEIAAVKKAPLFNANDIDLRFSRSNIELGSKHSYNPAKQSNFKNSINGWIFSKNTQDTSKVEYYLPLSGEVQTKNMKLAYMILEYLSDKYKFNLKVALKNIENLKWYGRAQVLPDGKILDGAHNPQAISELVHNLEDLFPDCRFTVIFACLEERYPEKVIEILSKISKDFIFVPINSSRKCFSPDEVLRITEKLDSEILCTVASSLKEAIETYDLEPIDKKKSSLSKQKGKCLITGSFYLAGEALLEYYNEDEIINI